MNFNFNFNFYTVGKLESISINGADIICIAGFLIVIFLFIKFQEEIFFWKKAVGIYLSSDFIELMFFEHRICIQNMIWNQKYVKNAERISKLEKELFGCFNNYGFYFLRQYQLNKKDTLDELNSISIPLFTSMIYGVIEKILEANPFFLIVVSGLIVFMFINICSSIRKKMTRQNDILFDGEELVNLYIDKYVKNRGNIKFDIGCLNDEDIVLFKKNVLKYFLVVFKVMIQEIRNDGYRTIDIFNLETEILSGVYGISNNGRMAYNKVKNIRKKFFEYNKIA